MSTARNNKTNRRRIFQPTLAIDHIFDFHQTHRCRTFAFVQLHFDVLDGFGKLRNHYVFQRVYATFVLFDFVGKHVAGFFRFGKFDEFVQHGVKSAQRSVQALGSRQETVRIQVTCFLLLDFDLRNVEP